MQQLFFPLPGLANIQQFSSEYEFPIEIITKGLFVFLFNILFPYGISLRHTCTEGQQQNLKPLKPLPTVVSTSSTLSLLSRKKLARRGVNVFFIFFCHHAKCMLNKRAHMWKSFTEAVLSVSSNLQSCSVWKKKKRKQ